MGKLMRRQVEVLILPFMLVLFGPASAQNTQISPRQLLLDVYDNYAELTSYSDKGEVTVTSFSGEKPKFTHKQEFTTHYLAPDSLKFEWNEKNPQTDIPQKYAVWGNADKIQSWVYQESSEPSWLKALSGAHGISNGVAFQVPPYLLKSCPSSPLHNALKVVYSNDISNSSEQEIRLKILFSNGSEQWLTIDANQKIITKIEYWLDSPERAFRAHTVINYHRVEVNKPVLAEELVFKPSNKSLQPTANASAE